MNCPFCSRELADNAKFCNKCGKAIPRCPSCNKVLTRKVKFCDGCGEPVSAQMTSGLPERKPKIVANTNSNINANTNQNINTNSNINPNMQGETGVPKSHFCKSCGKKIYGDNPICDDCQRKKAAEKGRKAEAQQTMTAGYEIPSEETKKKKTPILLIILVILLIIALCGVGGFIVYKHLSSDDSGSGFSFFTDDKDVEEDSDDTDDDSTEDDSINISNDEDTTAQDSDTTEATESTESQALQLAQQFAGQAESSIGEFDGHTYLIFNYKELALSESYESCERFCESLGGHLAVIESQEENDYIYNLVTSTVVNGTHLKIAFFGYSDAESEGNWKWVNGSTSTYTNWCQIKGYTQPNNGSTSKSKEPENYAEFYKETADGTWNDSKFGMNTYRFVCEWD